MWTINPYAQFRGSNKIFQKPGIEREPKSVACDLYRHVTDRMRNRRYKLACPGTTLPTFSFADVVLVGYNLNNLHSKTNEFRPAAAAAYV